VSWLKVSINPLMQILSRHAAVTDCSLGTVGEPRACRISRRKSCSSWFTPPCGLD